MDKKICSRCKLEKDLNLFSKDSKTKSGIRGQCKDCCSELGKIYRENNPEVSKKYREDNKEYLCEKAKKYYNDNTESIKQKTSVWASENVEKVREYKLKYYYSNKEKCNEQNRKWEKSKYNTDSFYRFKKSLRSLINKSIKSKSYSKKHKSIFILGCDIEFFKSYIYGQFVDGMSWDNYGEWEIDHIYPISLAKTEEEVIMLNHYTNLRPLWKEENREKLNKVKQIQLKLI